MKRVDVWHGILWSRYKGAVFSELHEVSASGAVHFKFFQVAETRTEREHTPVDLSYHRYPYTLLFNGSYDAIRWWRLYARLFHQTFRTDAQLILLGGYGRTEFWVQALAAVLAGKKIGVFCDSTLNDHRQTLIKSLLKRVFFSLCSVVFCYGRRSGELVERYGVARSRIRMPVSTAALPSTYDSAGVLSQRARGQENAARFLYVGRMAEEKRVGVLVEAFAQIVSHFPQATLTLVGDGPELQTLERLVDELGVRDAVRFAGSKVEDELFEYYADAACLVLPSQSEPWGLVVNEALSYGCPVVVSERCGCVPELVVDGKTGFSFRTGDVADLVAKMTAALGQFADGGRTAHFCLEQVAPFTPRGAARVVYDGCESVFGLASGVSIQGGI